VQRPNDQQAGFRTVGGIGAYYYDINLRIIHNAESSRTLAATLRDDCADFWRQSEADLDM